MWLKIEQLVVRFEESIQQRNCSLASLDYPCTISDLLAKRKDRFMLGNFSLAVMHLERNGRTYHICISLAYSKGKIRKKSTYALYIGSNCELCTIGRKVGGETQRTN